MGRVPVEACVPVGFVFFAALGCGLPDDARLPERLPHENLVTGPARVDEVAEPAEVTFPAVPRGDGVVGLHAELVRAKSFPEVVELLERYRALVRAGRDPVEVGYARFEMGVIYAYFFGDHERGVSLFTELWSTAPDHPRAGLARFLAACLYRDELGEIERSRQLFEELARLEPESFLGRVAREQLDREAKVAAR